MPLSACTLADVLPLLVKALGFVTILSLGGTAQERETAAQQAVEELSAQMAQLQAHNQELDNRERLLTSVVQTQDRHIDQLSRNEVTHPPHR